MIQKNLGSIAYKIGDGIHGTPVYSENGTYYFVNGNNLKNGKIIITNGTKKIDKNEYDKHKRLLNNSTILLSINGTIGNMAYYNNENIILGKSVCYINVKKSYYKEFIYHYLQSSKIQNMYHSELTGSTIKNLSLETIKKTELSIPSYEEQIKISIFLNKIDERINTQIKIIEILSSQRKCIFLNLNNNFSHKKIKISELGTMIVSNNLSKGDLSLNGKECILYGELFTKYSLYIDKIYSRTLKTDNSIISNGNEILFPTSTTVDAISLIKPAALCKKGVILGGDMFSIRLNNEYHPIYISCLINFVYKKELASRTQGSTIIHLHYDDIKNEFIEICGYERQREIVKFVECITKKIKVEEELLKQLYAQKSYLLQNLFI